MPSVRANNPTNCALVGGGLGDSTLRVRRQASGGKNENGSVNGDETTRKCFAFNKQRQRKKQGLQQGLATIPENSVYMTEYDRKGIHVGKEQAKEVKKCRLRNQKNEIKRRSMDDRHMKYQQYLERLALTPNEPNVWHTVCRQPLRLSAVSRERVMAPVNAQVNGNQHFSEEFLNFENSEEVLLSSVNEAMAVVAPEEYANIEKVTENHACVAHNHGQ